MTDRHICRRCIYYTNGDDVCNYILTTGEKRQFDGDRCYSFESGKRKRSTPLPSDTDARQLCRTKGASPSDGRR